MNAPDQLFDTADSVLREDAINNLVDRLLVGDTVHTLTSRDIFDCLVDDYSKPTYHTALDLLEGLAGLNYKCGDAYKIACYDLQEKAKELLKGFVLGHEEWILEAIEEIEHDRYSE